MTALTRRVGTVAAVTLFVAVWHVLRLPLRHELSAVAWVVTPSIAAVACWRAASRSIGATRWTWRLFAGTGAGWAAANVAFGWYELILGRPALSPSPVDAGYAVAVGCAAAATLVARQIVALLENQHLTSTLEQRVTRRTADLRTSEARLQSILRSVSDVVWLVRDGVIEEEMAGGLSHLGYEPGDLVGREATEFCHPAYFEQAATAGTAILAGEIETATFAAEVRRADGSWCPVEATITAVGGDGRAVVIAFSDTTERKNFEDRLRTQAYTDVLTGLPNRAQLHETMERWLDAGRRPTLLLLDLDGFKGVNDSAGHEVGDGVLIAVAKRLLACVRPGDLVARLGGDEFAVVLPDGAEAGQEIAERVLHALQAPVLVAGKQFRCNASVGVADADSDSTAAAILRDADVAMYEAKSKGRGRVVAFTSAMHEAVSRRRELEDVLRRSVTDGLLHLLYQPIVELPSGATAGVEALLRLHAPTGEVVSPVEFIPVAEETGLIVEIGAWVLETACAQVASWQALRPDGPPVELSVNLSTRQLLEPDLADVVAGALERSGLDASLLTLEITEGALGAGEVESTIRKLRQLGVRLSIDDFGTGYSSMSRLARFPVHELKIDRSFVQQIHGATEAPLVDAICALASRLRLEVVAEGIENEVQAEYLTARGCRLAQGFLYAKPLEPAALARRLRDRVVHEVANKALKLDV